MTREEINKTISDMILNMVYPNGIYKEKYTEEERKHLLMLYATKEILYGLTKEQIEKIRGEVKESGKYLYTCSKCDAFVKKNDDFCHRCGAPLTNEAVDKMFERWKEIFDEST